MHASTVSNPSLVKREATNMNQRPDLSSDISTGHRQDHSPELR